MSEYFDPEKMAEAGLALRGAAEVVQDKTLSVEDFDRYMPQQNSFILFPRGRYGQPPVSMRVSLPSSLWMVALRWR